MDDDYELMPLEPVSDAESVSSQPAPTKKRRGKKAASSETANKADAEPDRIARIREFDLNSIPPNKVTDKGAGVKIVVIERQDVMLLEHKC